ncbi:DedA family protein [Kocuria palustris]|uniref:DedA family protein n=1 Tax=Kocuria palustris TaxID=71999 RepID=UPI0011A5B735|nr:hypothetical protein [Kocuria palustris]
MIARLSSVVEAMAAWIESLPVVGAVLFFWAVGILRTSIVFWIARAAGSGGRRSRLVQRVVSSPAYLRAEAFVNRWGVLAVPACFLTVGFQTAVIVTTGLTRMPLVRWIPAMLAGTFMWGCIYGTVGMAVIQAWLREPLITAAVLVVLIALVIVLRAHWRRRDARRRLDPEIAAPLD